MTILFSNLKKTIFGPFPNFLGKTNFSEKSGCHLQPYKGFQHHAKFQRNLMIQFHENTRTDIRPYFIRPSGLPLGVKQIQLP